MLNNPRVSSSVSYAISGALATIVHDAVMNPAEVLGSCESFVFSRYSTIGSVTQVDLMIYKFIIT